MKNPFALHINVVHSLAPFDMSATPQVPKVPFQVGPHVGAIGIKGPWNLNPGSPDFPNHRPYLTATKPHNLAESTAIPKLKDY